jgi:hypothetical protein
MMNAVEVFPLLAKEFVRSQTRILSDGISPWPSRQRKDSRDHDATWESDVFNLVSQDFAFANVPTSGTISVFSFVRKTDHHQTMISTWHHGGTILPLALKQLSPLYANYFFGTFGWAFSRSGSQRRLFVVIFS